jgi:hypothetical protein
MLGVMARLYLNVTQMNPAAQSDLQELQAETPDRYNVGNGAYEGDGEYLFWVSYPDTVGEPHARQIVDAAIQKIGSTTLSTK